MKKMTYPQLIFALEQAEKALSKIRRESPEFLVGWSVKRMDAVAKRIARIEHKCERIRRLNIF